MAAVHGRCIAAALKPLRADPLSGANTLSAVPAPRAHSTSARKHEPVEDVRWDLQRWKWVHAAQSAVLEQGPDALADLLRFRVNRELPEEPTRARGSLQTEERPRRHSAPSARDLQKLELSGRELRTALVRNVHPPPKPAAHWGSAHCASAADQDLHDLAARVECTRPPEVVRRNSREDLDRLVRRNSREDLDHVVPGHLRDALAKVEQSWRELNPQTVVRGDW
jgi:hypothetical protein